MYLLNKYSLSSCLVFLSLVFAFWQPSNLQAQPAGLIVNELSQGESSSQKEFMELVVVGPPCTTVDIRGWMIDDNNGDFTDCSGDDNGALSGTGIAAGHIRFAIDPVWEEVPVGTIILVYADNPNIPAQQADIGGLTPDYDDSNCDFLRVVPINASNTFMERDANIPHPSNSGGDNTSCPNGTNGNPSYTPATYIPLSDDTYFGSVQFRNDGDAAQVRDDNGDYFHGISYGTSEAGSPNIIGGPDGLLVTTIGGSDRVYYFDNGASDDYTNVANYISGTATSEQTPGFPNSCLNAAWIESMRTAPDDEFQGAACPSTAAATTICAGVETTFSLSGICDSDSYLWTFDNANATIVGANNGKSVVIEGTSAGSATLTVTASNTYSYLYTNFNPASCSAAAQTDVFTFPITITSPDQPIISGNDVCGSTNATLSLNNTYAQYNWSNGATTPTASVGTAGTYTVTVTDGDGCTATDNIVVNASTPPTVDIENNSGTDLLEICEGDGTFLGATLSGNGPYSYNWSTGQTSNIITVTEPTAGTFTYTVTVTDGDGCTGTDDVDVEIIPLPSSANITVEECEDFPGAGIATGVDLTDYNDLLNDTPNIEIDWYDGDLNNFEYIDTPNNFDLPPSNNVLSVDIIDDINVSDCFISIIIPFSILPASNLTVTGNDFCEGETTTLAVVETFNSYLWSNGETTQTISVTKGGVYTVNITNVNDCTSTATVQVNEIPNASPTVNGSDFCAGTDATLSVAETFDTYSWSNGDAGQNISVNAPGTYTVTVQNSSGCTNTGEVTINELPDLNPTANGENFCSGSDATLFVTETYTSYNWSNGDATQTITVNSAGTYTVTVQDANGCTGTDEVSITQFSIAAPTVGGDDFCAGTNTTLSVDENYTSYNWSNGDSGQNINVNTTGTYTVTVQDASGCTSTGEVAVSQFPALTPTVNGADFCLNTSTTLSVSETYTAYDWSNGDAGQSISITSIGTYTVTVEDANGCTGTGEVTVNNLPSLTPTVNGEDFCFGKNTTLSVTETYDSYDWSNGDAGQSISVNTAGTYTVTVGDADGCTGTGEVTINEFADIFPTVNGNDFCLGSGTTLSVTENFSSYVWSNGGIGKNIGVTLTGTYTVTVEDANGCTGTGEVTVNELPALTPTVNGDDFCVGSSTTLTVLETYTTYDWSNGGSGQNINVNTAGTYTVTVEDADGCTGTAEVTVNQTTELNPTVNGSDVCIGGTTELFLTGTYNSYDWSNGDSGQNITVSNPGTYTVTVQDASGCIGTGEITIGVAPNLVPTVTGTDFCAGSSASLSVAETYVSYDWSNGLSGQNINVTLAGTYTVTVEDANGCTGTGQTSINVNPALFPTLVGDDLCAGSTTTLSVVETYDTYTWSNGDSGQNIDVGLGGTYTVTVQGATGCTGTEEITIGVVAALNPTVLGNDFCAGSSTNLSVAQTYDSYNWSNGDSGQIINVSMGGTYTVTVGDASGCTGTGQVTVNISAALNPTVNGNDFCAGSTTTLSVAETFNTYSWSNGDSGQNIEVGLGGTYTVTVEDAAGCTGTAEVSIVVVPALNPTVNGDDFCSGSNTTLSVAETFNTYSWSNGDSGQNIDVNTAGTYTVTVEDASGCTETGEVTVNELADLEPTVNGDDFCVGSNTTLSVLENFNTYSWSNGDSGQNITVNVVGTYTVTVQDANGCTGTGEVTVNETTSLTPTVNGSNFCIGFNTTLSVPGTYASYNWSNGDSGQNIEVSTAGTYTVTVQDATGCTGTGTISINELPNAAEPTLTGSDFCEGSSSIVSVTENYDSYEWSNGDSEQDIEVDVAGTYTVTVTNSDGCTNTGEITINQNANLSPTTSGEDFCAGSTATLSVNETFDTYSWSNGDSGQAIEVSLGGTYTVTVQDANGCTGTSEITVNVSAALNPTLSGDDFCAGTNTALAVNETFNTYSWSNGDSGQNITVNTFGTYTVTVEDATGCTGTAEITVNELADLEPTVNGDDFCVGSNTTLSVLETFNTYSWSNGDSGQNITVDVVGTYTVTVQDVNGCTGTGEVTVNETTSLTPTVNGSDFCMGFNTTLSVPGTYASYDWSNGDSGQNIEVSTAGTYTVTVQDATGCTGTGTISINELPNAAEPTLVGSDFCEGSSTTISVTENYDSYQWSNGDSGQNIEVNMAGTYTVTVTNSDGCTNTDEITLQNIDTPSVSINGEDICEGSTATLSVVESFDTYLWSNGDLTPNATVNTSGTYFVTVSNTDDCTATASYTVNLLDSPDPNINGSLIFCEGGNTTLTVSETFVSYNWSTNESTQSISVDDGGIYVVTVTNTEGCSAETAVSVAERPLPTATVSTNSPICEGENAVLTIELTGTAPWALQYFNGSGNATVNIPSSPHTINLAINQNATINLLSVTDSFCSNDLTESADIVVNETPSVSNIQVVCDDTNTSYTVSFDISGGDADTYDVTGDSGSLVGNTFTSAPIASGDVYSFSVVDGSQCEAVVVNGTNNCNCATFAGTMPMTPIEVCEDEVVSSVNNGNETLDGDDLLAYILHNNVGTSIGTIFAQNNTGSFTFADASPPINYNTTYYISAIAGSDDGSGNIDLNDECLSVASGTAVSFLQNPVPIAEEGGTTCGTTWDLVVTPSAGVGTWTASPSAGVTFADETNASTIVTVSNTGTYTFTWAEDNNGCVGSTNVEVVFTEGVTVDAGNDDEVCNDEYDLEADNGGEVGIWTANPSAGVTFTDDTDPNTRVEVAAPGVYTFTWTFDNGECTASDDVEITFYDGIGVVNRTHECTDNEFVVTFEIVGGDGNYLVDGSTDGLVGNVFTSQPFTSGTEYTFTITDSSPCFTFILIDDFFCNCTTDAGLLPTQTIEACGFDASVSVTATNPTLDDNDVLVYALHDGTTPLNILMSSTDGQFAFDEAILDYETTYFITALAGNDNDADGIPDSAHPCYDTSNNTPVIFYGQPSVTVTEDCGLTQNLTALLQTSTGTEAWSNTGVWSFMTTGSGSINFNNANNPNTSFTASTAGDYTITWTGAGGCSSELSTTLIEPLSASWTAECAADLLTYTITLTIEGGTTPYIVNNNPVAGNVYTETFNSDEGFSFDIDDNGVCEAINVSGTWDCDCPSPATPSPVAAEQSYCEGEAVPDLAVTDNGVDSYFWYNNPNDANSIFEGAVFSPSSGTATYWVQAVSPDGCVSNFVPIDLIENASPNNPIGNDESYCEGDAVLALMVTDNGVDTYFWFADTTAASIAEGASFAPSMAGLYWVQAVSSNNCVSDFVEIEVTELPSPENPIGNDESYCEGDTVPALMVTDNGVDNYFWYADSTAASIANGASFTPSMAGTYFAQAISAGNCASDFVEIELIEFATPPAPTVADVSICQGTLLPNPIEASTTGGTLNWSADTGASNIGTFDGSGFAIGDHVITIFEESAEGCESASVSFVLTVEDCSQVCPTVTSAPTASFESCDADDFTLEIALDDPDNTLERIEWVFNGSVVATGVTSLEVNGVPVGCDPTVLIYTANIYCSLNPNTPIPAGTFDLTLYPLADATITVVNGGCTIQAQPTCPNFSIVGDDTATTNIDGDNSTVVFTVQNDDTTLDNNCMTTINANFNCVITECPTIASIDTGTSICTGDNIQLSATINDPNGKLDRIEWLDESGTVISNNLDFTLSENVTGCDAQTFNYTLQIFCDDDPNTPVASNTSTWTVYPTPENIVAVGGCSLEVTGADCAGNLVIVYSNDNGTTWLPSPNDTPTDGETWLWQASIAGAPDGCNLSGEVTAVCDCTPPQTPIAVSDQQIEICEGEAIPSFEVMLVDGDFVAWYDVATGGEAVGQDVTFTPIEAGTYYAEVGNNDDECVSERLMFELVVNSLSDASFTYPDTFYCLGDAVIPVPDFVATPGGTFSIDNDLFIDGNTGAFNVSGLAEPGIITITYTTPEPCSSSESVEIEVGNNDLTLNVGEDIEACEGEPISLNATLQGVADLQWSVNGVTGNFSDPLGLITNFITSDTGSFTLYLTAVNECGDDAEDSLQVNISPTVFIDIEGNTNIVEGESTTLEASSDRTDDFIWFSNEAISTLSCTDCPNPVASPVVNTTYFVTSNEVCADTASVTVQVQDVQTFVIAVTSAFSPNGDGMNDEFIVEVDGNLADYNIMIFNRWGEKVFESSNINEPWNGVFDDEIQPIGVYAYLIRYQIDGQDTKIKSGNVTIIR